MKPFAIFLVVLTIGAGGYYALRPQKISVPASVASEVAPEISVQSTDSPNESETVEMAIAPLPAPVPPQPTRPVRAAFFWMRVQVSVLKCRVGIEMPIELGVGQRGRAPLA